jgi:hypothetical protein
MPIAKTQLPQPPAIHRHKAVLRVQVLMAEHDIRFVTDLWKKLTVLGVEISHSQLTRVVNNSTKTLNIDLLEGMATLFDCPVASLFKDV